MSIDAVVRKFSNLFEMDKVRTDMFIGGLSRRNRKGFGNPGEIGIEMRVVIFSGIW